MACSGDHDMAGNVVADPPHQERQLRYRAEHLDALLIDQPPDFGELEACRVALDEPPANPVLQAPQGVADAGLLEVKALGGTGDALHFGDDDERPQKVPIEVPDQTLRARQSHS